jgi:primosomal protein N' (replication factor Y) (superfamily II helicase)
MAGRAGRSELRGRVLIQTRQMQHPLFKALQYPHIDAFYAHLLSERQFAYLPPYGYQAVLRAHHLDLNVALSWLNNAKEQLMQLSKMLPLLESAFKTVNVFSPIPMLMPKIARQARAQLLFESVQRSKLHQLLSYAMPLWLAYDKLLKSGDEGYGVSWHIEIDPVEV